MPFARFSVSQDGITESMSLKQHFHAWSEFREYGILGINVDYVMGTPVAETYWVYFSTTYLNSQERERFLRKTRKNLKQIAFFQYNKAVLDEILPVLPKPMKDTLKERSVEIEEQMNWLEKVYHK